MTVNTECYPYAKTEDANLKKMKKILKNISLTVGGKC